MTSRYRSVVPLHTWATKTYHTTQVVSSWPKVVADSGEKFYFLQHHLYTLRILLAKGTCFAASDVNRRSIACMAWLRRNLIQSEVSIHATCSNLICCKTCLNMCRKTCNIAFYSICHNVSKQMGGFCFPFYRSFVVLLCLIAHSQF